jgi:hypothetical protein
MALFCRANRSGADAPKWPLEVASTFKAGFVPTR